MAYEMKDNSGSKNDDQERWQGLRFKPKDNQKATNSNATNNTNNEITEDDIPF